MRVVGGFFVKVRVFVKSEGIFVKVRVFVKSEGIFCKNERILSDFSLNKTDK